MDRTADWRRAVDVILAREYAITLLDAGLSDDEIERCSADEPDPRALSIGLRGSTI
jgi:hypothetical protein